MWRISEKKTDLGCELLHQLKAIFSEPRFVSFKMGTLSPPSSETLSLALPQWPYRRTSRCGAVSPWRCPEASRGFWGLPLDLQIPPLRCLCRWGTSYFTRSSTTRGKGLSERPDWAEMGRNSDQQTQAKRHTASEMAEDTAMDTAMPRAEEPLRSWDF